jgi:hypothetical protein
VIRDPRSAPSVKIGKGNAIQRQEWEWKANWRPTPEGLNFPHWWLWPIVINPNFPFPSAPWELTVPPPHESFRTIFHGELCTSPPAHQSEFGVSDWPQVDDSCYTDLIQICVDNEFDRLFALAEVNNTHCAASQVLWRVLHYCKLPCNTMRNKGGEAISHLLRQEAYHDINIDSLRWIRPSHFDRHLKIALRLVPVIIEQCIFKTKTHGLKGVAPPVPGSWGFAPLKNEKVLNLMLLSRAPGFTYRPLLVFKINPFCASASSECPEPQVDIPLPTKMTFPSYQYCECWYV